jgi:hypothetical protein
MTKYQIEKNESRMRSAEQEMFAVEDEYRWDVKFRAISIVQLGYKKVCVSSEIPHCGNFNWVRKR